MLILHFMEGAPFKTLCFPYLYRGMNEVEVIRGFFRTDIASSVLAEGLFSIHKIWSASKAGA